MSTSNKNQKYATAESGMGWMGRVDVEVARAKKSTVSPTSRYYKGNRNYDAATSNCGFRIAKLYDEEKIGSIESWNKGYEFFCKRKKNTKGNKVKRLHLLEYRYDNVKFGAGELDKSEEED